MSNGSPYFPPLGPSPLGILSFLFDRLSARHFVALFFGWCEIKLKLLLVLSVVWRIIIIDDRWMQQIDHLVIALFHASPLRYEYSTTVIL
jgi:hypothetical protein